MDLRLHSPEFEIIDESPDWIVVNKPPHLLVHPSKPGQPATLLEGLEQLLVYELATGGRISIVNRLDRETSGLVLAAKTREAASRLGKASHDREFIKTYQALVWGWPKEDSFRIEEPICRRGDVTDSEIYVQQMVHPRGKPCATGVRVLSRFERETGNGDRFSLLECRLETGRMHQIRVHLSHAGHPVVGDKMYGPSPDCYLRFIREGWTEALAKRLLLDRQALHAAELRWGDFHWRAPFPDDMGEFLEKER